MVTELSKEQVKQLEEEGFTYDAVPGVHRCLRATFYRLRKDGSVEPVPDLPMDSYHLPRWLKRGLVLDPKDLIPQTKEDEEFVCTVCGKAFSAKIALTGHSRSHK